MLHRKKRALGALLALAVLAGLTPAALADGAVTLMPGVTPEMSEPRSGRTGSTAWTRSS